MTPQLIKTYLVKNTCNDKKNLFSFLLSFYCTSDCKYGITAFQLNYKIPGAESSLWSVNLTSKVG